MRSISPQNRSLPPDAKPDANPVRKCFLLTACIALPLLIASCSDDPELVNKRNLQQAEILQLQAELAIIEQKLQSMPENIGEQLKEAEEKLKSLTAEVQQLEQEATELQKRKTALENEFTAYREKFPIP